MRRTARTAGTIGLPFYWLILASLAVVVVPWYLLVKGLIALIQLIARGQRLHRTIQVQRPDPEREAWRRRMASHLAGTAHADLIPQARHSNRR
jgi:hypothetical protein